MVALSGDRSACRQKLSFGSKREVRVCAPSIFGIENYHVTARRFLDLGVTAICSLYFELDKSTAVHVQAEPFGTNFLTASISMARPTEENKTLQKASTAQQTATQAATWVRGRLFSRMTQELRLWLCRPPAILHINDENLQRPPTLKRRVGNPQPSLSAAHLHSIRFRGI